MSMEWTYEQMPLWMRRSQQRFDWGIVFALLIGLLAAWPFLSHPQLALTNGQLQDAFRTADTAAMLREGRLYPRWSPHAFSGYGAPIPNYIPPGAPYLAAMIEVLFTDDTLTALRIAYSLALIGSSVGLYLLVARWSGCTQGLLATALYTLSPLVGLTLAHLEGDLALLLSTALLPLILWAFDRLLHDKSPLDLLFTTSLIALQLLIDPRLALTAFLFCLVILVVTERQRPISAAIRLRSLAAWLCGVCLAAMFWLPALAESSLVIWRSQPVAPPTLPVTVGQLLQPISAIDAFQLKPDPQYTLGLPLWSATSVVAALWITRRIRLSARFQAMLLTTFMLSIVLVVLAPTVHWLLLPITLAAAMTASSVSHVIDLLPGATRRILPALLLGGLLVSAYPIWLASAPNLPVTSVTPADQVRYEQMTGRSALLTSGAKLPTTLPQTIDSNPLLTSSYSFTKARSFDTLSKIVPAQLTRNGQLNILWQHTHESLFRIPDDQNRITRTNPENASQGGTTAAPTFTWLTASFPGWEAKLEGQPLRIVTDPTTNLLRVELPTGSSGALLLQLNATTARAVSWGVCGLAGVILLLLTRLAIRQDVPEARVTPLRYMRTPDLRLFGVLAGCFLLLFVFLNAAPAGNALRASAGANLRAALPIRVQTSVGLQLFGYRTAFPAIVNAQDRLELDLYWRALRTLPENYWIRLSLNPVTAESPTSAIILAEQMPGDLPTRLWPTERYVRDRYAFKLPDDLPAGIYLIGLELFACNSAACETTAPGAQVALFAENSRTAITRLDLPELIEIQP